MFSIIIMMAAILLTSYAIDVDMVEHERTKDIQRVMNKEYKHSNQVKGSSFIADLEVVPLSVIYDSCETVNTKKVDPQYWYQLHNSLKLTSQPVL
ncbi:hypothetical protein EB796_014504 [Bugula neritina]|uniref:Uncharacterized protein n=1 Tax=Bugula neritina TaxID=10212 RepID=A0A7J7JMU9_BUGNE|nr:hypothetical protein EB796_014504 [Bugula neritina]